MEKLTKNDILAEVTANNGACYISDDELDFAQLEILVAEGKVEIGERAEGETMVAFTTAYVAEILGPEA